MTLFENKVKMRSFRQALIQYGVLMRRRNLGTKTLRGGRQREELKGGGGHLGAKRRGLEEIPPSQPSAGASPDTLILDLQPPELQDHQFLWFKPPRSVVLRHGEH